ncbi:hypothetical protein Tco_0143398 [Tanacetum coccineum]
MAKQQTIKYAPQWNNMTVDNVIFQTNNVVGNFNYPQNVPTYKPIMKFLLNCPVNKALTNCPSVVYQNFLREFWSTIVAYDPFLSTDEPEKCPLREFIVKFSFLNGQRPLTLDFKTFCSSTGLDYNNDNYVAHLTPKVMKKELGKIAINPSYLDKTPVLKNSFPVAWRIKFTFMVHVLDENYSSTKQVNSIQQLLTYCLITGNDGLEASGAPSKKSKRPKSKKPPIETKIEYIQLASTGYALPLVLIFSLVGFGVGCSTLNEGTHKSKPLPKGTVTHPKDLGRNIQTLNRDLNSMTSDEGMAKTTPRLKGSLGDKDSGGNIPPVDIKPIHTTIADPSGTVAKYQADKTQSTRLRQQPLTKNKGKTSSEVDPDTEPLKLQTFADVQAFLLSKDELDKESDKEEVLAVGEDMDEDIHVAEDVRTPSPKQDHPLMFKNLLLTHPEKHEEVVVHYVNLKTSIDDYNEENIAHKDQTDKLVEASMSSLDKSNTTISDLYKGLNVIIELLKDIHNVSTVKDLQAYALKQDEELAAWAKSSTNMACNLGSRISGLERAQTTFSPACSLLKKTHTSSSP